MEVELLGDVTVVGDAGACSIDSPLARHCLAALSLAAGSVTLDGLADALWGEDRPANWKQALRNVVARLRMRLESIGGGGDAIVVTTPTGYRLAPGCGVDVHVALGRADAADEALKGGDPDRALDLAISAYDRLQRTLLADVEADWVRGYRTRVEWARARSLQVAAAASRTVGRTAQAIEFARRAVAEDPLAEESHRQLMAAHVAAGDRASALRTFEECRRTLATELGISPDRATTDLHLEILGSEPPRPTRHRAAAPLFGRTGEMAMLRERVDGGAVVTVSGPGGIGKSRLADAFAHDADSGFDGTAVFVECDGMRDGEQVLPALTTALGVRPGSEDAFKAVQRELAGRGRLLLVFDGVDLVTDEVASLIATLITLCPDTALLVTGRLPLGLDVETALRPAPLDPDGAGRECFIDVASTAGVDLGGDEATRAAIADVCRAVGGIPLGIELAARQVGEMSVADLADRLAVQRIDDDGRPAPLIETVVDSTIALLDDAELAVFRRLSVIGGPVDLALIQATVADELVPVRRVVRILAQLAERALIRLDRTAVRWSYDQHQMLRSAGRARLTAPEVRALNDRLGSAVFARLPPTATAAPPVSEIMAVLPAVRSVLGAALAGEADLAVALRLAFWLHRFWASAALDEGRQWLQRLLEVDTTAGSDRGQAEFALGYLLFWSGRPDAAVDHLETATRLLDATDPLLPGAHYFTANAVENRRPELARFHYGAAVDAAAAAGLHDLAIRCSVGLATLEFEGGDRTAGRERYEAALHAIESSGDEDAMAMVLPQYAWMLISLRELDEAHLVLQRVERTLGDDARITTMIAAAARARLERFRGRPDVARRHARRAATMIADAGVGRLDGLVSSTLALTDLSKGDIAAATAELARGVKAAMDTDQLFILVDILDAATHVGVALGRVDEAFAIHAASNELRRRGQVRRGDPEQAELDAALATLRPSRVTVAGDPDHDLDMSAVADLVIGMAAG